MEWASESERKWAAVLESSWGVLKYLDFAQSLSAFFYMCMGDPMSCWTVENKYLVLKHISCYIIGKKIYKYLSIYIDIFMYIYDTFRYQLISLAKEENLEGKKKFTKKNHILPSHVSFKLCYLTLLCFTQKKTKKTNPIKQIYWSLFRPC